MIERRRQLSGDLYIIPETERNPVEQTIEPSPQFAGHLRRSADNGERVEDLVIDQIRHIVPAPGLRQKMEILVQRTPAMEFQDTAIGRSRSVKRDLFSDLRSPPVLRLRVATGPDQRDSGDLEVGAVAPASGKAGFDRRQSD